MGVQSVETDDQDQLQAEQFRGNDDKVRMISSLQHMYLILSNIDNVNNLFTKEL